MRLSKSAFFFIFFLFAFSVSGYQVIHYDDFDYNAIGAELLNHGFFGTGTYHGYKNCAASTDGGTNHYLMCVENLVDGNRSAFQAYNNLPTGTGWGGVGGNQLSRNWSFNGGAINFSVRVRFRGVCSVPGYDSNSNVEFGQPHTLNAVQFGINDSGSKNYVWLDAAIDQVAITEPFSYGSCDWYTAQVDYYTRDIAGTNNYEYYWRNLSVEGVYNSSWTNSGDTATWLNSVNNFSNVFYISGDETVYYLDYIIVVAYDAEEAFISINDTITDYYTLADNEMPSHSTTWEDAAGAATFSVKLSKTIAGAGADVGYCNHSNVIADTDCNPLVVDTAISDTESNTMYIAHDCGEYPSETLGYDLNFTEDFTDSLSDILIRWDVEECNYTIGSLDGVNSGLHYPSSINCTQTVKTHFTSDYPDSDYYMTDSWDYFFNFTYTPKDGYRQNIELVALDGLDTFIGILYNGSTNKSSLYAGDRWVWGTPLVKLYEFESDGSNQEVSLMLNHDSNKWAVKIQDDNNVFYSDEQALSWASPFYIAQFYMDTPSNEFTDAFVNQTIGLVSIKSIRSLPDFEEIDSSPVRKNCTSTTAGNFQGILFFTDDAHDGNYLDYAVYDWDASYYGTTGFIPSTGTDFVTAIFGDSDNLKYLFSLFLIITITIGCMLLGAKFGSVMAGVWIAVFTDMAAIFVLLMIGLLPVWFGVVMFMVLALFMAMMISRWVGGGSSEGG